MCPCSPAPPSRPPTPASCTPRSARSSPPASWPVRRGRASRRPAGRRLIVARVADRHRHPDRRRAPLQRPADQRQRRLRLRPGRAVRRRPRRGHAAAAGPARHRARSRAPRRRPRTLHHDARCSRRRSPPSRSTTSCRRAGPPSPRRASDPPPLGRPARTAGALLRLLPDRTDGLGVNFGPLPADPSLTAALLIADATVPNADGVIAPDIAWAALDCPSYAPPLWAHAEPTCSRA